MVGLIFILCTTRGEFMSSNNSPGRVYLTRKKMSEIEEELRDLKVNGRRKVAHDIAEARGHGDLSENAEYDAAKEAQQHLERKIMQLETTLLKARVIESGDLPNDKIYILSIVNLQDTRTNETMEYTLVSNEEADFDEGKISVSSPIGKALLGKTRGEVVKIKVPAGVLEYKILEISR
jgi:transcription elongation factor GreA